jgi:hypothetical protein
LAARCAARRERADRAAEDDGADPITLAGVPVSGLRADLHYGRAAGRVEVSDLRLALASRADAVAGNGKDRPAANQAITSSASLNVRSARFDTDSRAFRVVLGLDTGSLPALLDTIRRNAGPALAETSGGARALAVLGTVRQRIGGGAVQVETLEVGGRIAPARSGRPARLDDRIVHVALSGRDLVVAGVEADTFTVDARLNGDRLTIEQALARNDETNTTISLTGAADLSEELDPNNPLKGNIDPKTRSSSNPTTRRSHWARCLRPTLALGGRVSITAVATGRTHTPTVNTSLEGRDIAIGGRSFDRISAPRIVLAPRKADDADGSADGRLEIVDRVLVLENDNRVEITGYLPFSYEKIAIPDDAPLNIAARLPEQDMDLSSPLPAYRPPKSSSESAPTQQRRARREPPGTRHSSHGPAKRSPARSRPTF